MLCLRVHAGGVRWCDFQVHASLLSVDSALAPAELGDDRRTFAAHRWLLPVVVRAGGGGVVARALTSSAG